MSPTGRTRGGRIAGVGAIVALLAGAGGARAAEPFYLERMTAGIRALERGDLGEAAKELRIACFGLLEEPLALVDCLSHLALTQSGLGDTEAFRQTFQRIVELESRFSAYGQAELEPGLRSRLEQEIVRHVPARALEATPAFRHLAERPGGDEFAGLTPRQLRRALEAKLGEGNDAGLVMRLARLELDEGRPRRALGWLERLPEPGGEAAACLLREAAAAAGDCATLLPAPACADASSTQQLAELDCLAAARDWSGAAAALERLPEAVRAAPRAARLEHKIREQLGAETAAVPPTVSATAEAPAPPAEAAGADPAAEEAAALRVRITSARGEEQMKAVLADAAALADRLPDSRPAQLLAAEASYLLADWPRAVDYCRRAGLPGADEPQLSFYCAVALFESGEPQQAAELLRPALARLERSDFVDSYLRRILPGELASTAAPPSG